MRFLDVNHIKKFCPFFDFQHSFRFFLSTADLLKVVSDRIASDFNRFNSTQDIGNDVLSLSTSFDNFFSSEFMFSEISVRAFSLISSQVGNRKLRVVLDRKS